MSSKNNNNEVITLETRGRVAIITINNPKQLNALTQDQFFVIGQYLREIAKRDDVFVTVLTAKGRFFSAGANVSGGGASSQGPERGTDAYYKHFLQFFVANNLNITQAFYTHPKILVTALNGPVVGITAALIAFSDFIYATPQTYLLTPFSSLGLLAEGGSSRAFVQRMGIAKANEALIMSKKISAEELVACGFVNRIFHDVEKTGEGKFLERVLKEVDDYLGEHLVSNSLVQIKKLIRAPESEALDRQNVAELMGAADIFMKGIPQEEFRKIASGEKRHKL